MSLKRLHDMKQFPSTSNCVWFVIFLFNRFSLPQTLPLLLFFNNFDEQLLPFTHSLEMSYEINEEKSLLSYFSLDYWLHFYWHPRDSNWLLIQVYSKGWKSLFGIFIHLISFEVLIILFRFKYNISQKFMTLNLYLDVRECMQFFFHKNIENNVDWVHGCFC